MNLDTIGTYAEWALPLLRVLAPVPVILAVSARARNAVYVSAEALTLLVLASLLQPELSQTAGRIHTTVLLLALVLVVRAQRRIWIPIPSTETQDKIEEALSTPEPESVVELKRFPYHTKVVLCNALLPIPLSFVGSDHTLVSLFLNRYTHAYPHLTLAQAVRFQMLYTATMMSMSATLDQATRIAILLNLVQSNPKVQPYQIALAQQSNSPRLPAFCFAWITISTLATIAQCTAAIQTLIQQDFVHAPSIVITSLTAAQILVWPGLALVILLRRRRTAIGS